MCHECYSRLPVHPRLNATPVYLLALVCPLGITGPRAHTCSWIGRCVVTPTTMLTCVKWWIKHHAATKYSMLLASAVQQHANTKCGQSMYSVEHWIMYVVDVSADSENHILPSYSRFIILHNNMYTSIHYVLKNQCAQQWMTVLSKHATTVMKLYIHGEAVHSEYMYFRHATVFKLSLWQCPLFWLIQNNSLILTLFYTALIEYTCCSH